MFRQYRVRRLRRLIAREQARIDAFNHAIADATRIPIYLACEYVEACERKASLTVRLNQLLSS